MATGTVPHTMYGDPAADEEAAGVLEDELRREIQECQRELVRVQAESLAAEGHFQEVEEEHQEELAVLCSQLDALDSHLLMEHNEQATESQAAQGLLRTARRQLAEMHEEVLSVQAHGERLEEESRQGRPQLEFLSAELQRRLHEEHEEQAELASVRSLVETLQQQLSTQESEGARLEQRRWHTEDALRQAEVHICNFEDWSQGVHDELREVATELQADQRAAEEERRRLEVRAADLERTRNLRGGLAEEAQGMTASFGDAFNNLRETTPQEQFAASCSALSTALPGSAAEVQSLYAGSPSSSAWTPQAASNNMAAASSQLAPVMAPQSAPAIAGLQAGTMHAGPNLQPQVTSADPCESGLYKNLAELRHQGPANVHLPVATPSRESPELRHQGPANVHLPPATPSRESLAVPVVSAQTGSPAFSVSPGLPPASRPPAALWNSESPSTGGPVASGVSGGAHTSATGFHAAAPTAAAGLATALGRPPTVKETGQHGLSRSATPGTPEVLWCRKVPSQSTLQVSRGAPALV